MEIKEVGYRRVGEGHAVEREEERRWETRKRK